jgi:hypothetical protein
VAVAHQALLRDDWWSADGEVAWSWRPVAGVKVVAFMTSVADDGGKTAGPQGDRV